MENTFSESIERKKVIFLQQQKTPNLRISRALLIKNLMKRNYIDLLS
ncbi:MAG: hypothetical protein AVDCRST_MAG96-3688 [uncultured Segetibacter sp.]|uniref:Uncharacterized protein n=1 Tax=uncultured Segetibacter sp. TaxID=481133 RepID=A0A6J4TWN9_9BACT|nr:MAG: hypothetical protein AVDCRST_MAG96-3688 [uncultured Segetibacter sp.]